MDFKRLAKLGNDLNVISCINAAEPGHQVCPDRRTIQKMSFAIAVFALLRHSVHPACRKVAETVPVDDPETTFSRIALTGKPKLARALLVAAERALENHVAALEMNELEPASRLASIL
jgi:hypothetical protein